MRLLFVYGFEPSGHASAARALEACAREAGHEPRCLNISAEHHELLGPAISKTYLQLVQKLPALYDAMHESEALAEIAQIWREVYHFFEGGRLRARLAELAPDVIVCTHAPPLGLLALEKQKGELAVPLAAVITDFQAHPYWAAKGPDLFLTATREAADALVGRGAAPIAVHVTGIPIHPAFALPLGKPQARVALGQPADAPLALLTGGGRGLGRLRELAEEVLAADPALRVLAVCGSNAEALVELESRFAGEPRLSARGRLAPEAMREAMAAADFLVGKAGGLTSSECLAAALPMILFEPLAGQEERNAEYLVRQGAALRADTLGELRAAVAGLRGEAGREALQTRARRLGRPDAARRAVEAIAGLAARGSS